MFVKTTTKKLLKQAAVLSAPLLLVGCSSVPDAVNPVEWYRSSVEYFSDDTPAAQQEGAQPTAQAATAPSSAPVHVGQGFVKAEKPSRQYAEPVMRQGDVVNALGEERTVVAQVEQPAPAPAPQVASTPQPLNVKPAETVVVQAPATGQSVDSAVRDRIDGVSSARDNRSVGEIFASNIAQTRPLDISTSMRGTDTLMGIDQFQTVVVSSSGVQQAPSPMVRPMQMASLDNNVMTSGMRDTMSVGMALEPSVVKNGQAISLSRFNPSMFRGSFQVATIQFGNGSAKLSAEDIRILKEVVTIHQQQGGVVRVVGHASSRTRDMTPNQHVAVNTKVSMGRADRVAKQLLKLGLTGDRLFVGGVSDSQPLYQEVMPSGEAGNRRTEIYIDY